MILVRKVSTSSRSNIICFPCPPPCGHFSFKSSPSGEVSYKVKKLHSFEWSSYFVLVSHLPSSALASDSPSLRFPSSYFSDRFVFPASFPWPSCPGFPERCYKISSLKHFVNNLFKIFYKKFIPFLCRFELCSVFSGNFSFMFDNYIYKCL